MTATGPDVLAAFARALRNPALPAPPGLRCWNGSDPMARLAVHRNGMRVSLTQALAETFPALHQALGSDDFTAMARAFIGLHPPRSSVLTDYGDDLPAFLARSAAGIQRPWLPDLARLERQRVRACHAADAAALDRDTLAGLLAAPAALPGARLALHPSLAVCASAHAVVALWLAWQAGGGRGAASQPAQAAIVLRDADAVLVLNVALAAAACIQALADGATLQAAVHAGNAVAADSEQGWSLADTLALLVRHGAVTGWQPGAAA